MRGWGIHYKMLFLALFPALMIGVGLYSYFTSIYAEEMERGLVERGRSIVENLAPASEYGVITGNTVLLSNLVNAVLNDPEINAVAIRDMDDKPLLLSGESLLMGEKASSLERDRICARSPEAILFCAPIRLARLSVSDFGVEAVQDTTDIVGWVYVENTLTIYQQRIRAAMYQSFFITLGIVFSAVVLAFVSGRQLAQTVVDLTKAVKRVRNGELDTVVKITDNKEIGMLQSGLNSMIDSLRNAQAELTRQVNEATRQLREAMYELEQKNKDLMQQREKADQASQAKSRFLATMSHEIRTPLSGMVGILTLLKQTSMSATQGEYVENLELAAKSLRDLIEDILDLSRIEAGKLNVNREIYRPTTIINEMVAMLAPTAHAKDVEFIVFLDPLLPDAVYGDATRLRQVLINLIANAIKFTEKGSIVLRAISMGTPVEGVAPVRFEVEDTGIGIAKSKQADIFDSFVQVDNSSTRRYKGTGLGTAISKELVGLMNGRIGLRSDLGQGSLFWFELPLEIAVEANHRIDNPSGIRILVLEKNTAAREVLHSYAYALSLSVDSVDSAQQFLARLQGSADQYDIVMIAENSRASENMDLIRRVREIFEGGRLPYLMHLNFFSGKTNDTLFDIHVSKPLSMNGLSRLLQNFSAHEPLEEPGDGVHDNESMAVKLDVLVVEDDPINAKVLGTFLSQLGHSVHMAINGQIGLDIMRQQPVDLVFMDMQMPEMDGPTAARLWREEEAQGGHITIIALTANFTIDDKAVCLAAGMDGFISKPIELDKLKEILRQEMNAHL